MSRLIIKTEHINVWTEDQQRAMHADWDCAQNPVPVGHSFDMGSVSYETTETPQQMVRRILKRGKNHPRETYERDGNRVIVKTKTPHYGLIMKQTISVEG